MKIKKIAIGTKGLKESLEDFAAAWKKKEAGLVTELTGRRRNRVFCYPRYLEILAEGTKPAHSEQADSVLVETISAGDVHACGLKSDGVVVCWGWDYSGQSTPPTMIFTQVSAGGSHTCGLTSDGTLACWGRNDEGQIAFCRIYLPLLQKN